MLLKIKTALESEGMTIPFPQRTVWIKETPGSAPAPVLHPDVSDKQSGQD
jgi:small-conductance mechanosensitive channel